MVSLSRDGVVNSITMAWLTKITSHMDGEELFRQIIGASMMANSKMEHPMAIFEVLLIMVAVFKKNIKMAID